MHRDRSLDPSPRSLRALLAEVAGGYAFAASFFLLAGFALALLIRWQLAYPGRPVPLVGAFLGRGAVSGVMLPEFYNQLVAMHGTIMVFLGVVPMAFGAFGGGLVPAMIGASGMAFPRLHRLSLGLFVGAGLLMLASFFAPGGAAQAGWTAYPPLADIAPTGQTIWLLGILAVGASSLLAAAITIATIVAGRAPGLTWMRLPYFVWAQLVTALLLLLAFPALAAAAVLQLSDRLAGASFFLPSGLAVAGQPLAVSGGGSPILWQHLFWFLAHPEVYVLILPAFGIVAEVYTAHGRRPLAGYRPMVAATLGLGALSLIVWAHHMFLTGMGVALSSFFQATTLLVSIPSVVIATALLATLFGAAIRYTTAMLFALAFLPLFAIGGLTGLPLGLAVTDVPLHDTWYVVGHFHFVVAPGTLFALFAGFYHWFPRWTGRRLDERLGIAHFVLSLVGVVGTFGPMFHLGLAGVSRRLYDGGASYAFARELLPQHGVSTAFAALLGIAQLPFLVNLASSVRRGAPAGANPWQASTLEWEASPQPTAIAPWRIRAAVGASAGGVAIRLGLAASAMFFGSLVSAWALLRTPGTRPPLAPPFVLGVAIPLILSLALASGRSRTVWSRGRSVLGAAALGLVGFAAGVAALADLAARGLMPRAGVPFALAWVLGGLALAQLLVAALALVRHRTRARRDAPEDAVERAAAVLLLWRFAALVAIVAFGLLGVG